MVLSRGEVVVLSRGEGDVPRWEGDVHLSHDASGVNSPPPPVNRMSDSRL